MSRRPLSMLFAAGFMLFGASVAHADTRWSIGINLPVPGVIVSNGGGYYRDAAPAYYYDEPAPVVRYTPAPAYGAPVYERPWRAERDDRWERHREWERARFERSHRDRDGRWDRDDHRRGDRDGDGRGWRRD